MSYRQISQIIQGDEDAKSIAYITFKTIKIAMLAAFLCANRQSRSPTWWDSECRKKITLRFRQPRDTKRPLFKQIFGLRGIII